MGACFAESNNTHMVSHNQRLSQYKLVFCQKCHFCFNTNRDFTYHLDTRYCEFSQSLPYSNLRTKINSIVPSVTRLTKAQIEGAANFDKVTRVASVFPRLNIATSVTSTRRLLLTVALICIIRQFWTVVPRKSNHN